MEMRRLQPVSELIERIAALEDSLRTGTPPARTNSPSSAGGDGPRSSTSGSKAASSSSTRATGHARGTAVKLAVDPRANSESEPQLASLALIDRELKNSGVTELGTINLDESSDIERLKTALEKRRKKFLVIALEGARVARIEGDELYVEFAPDAKHLRDTLAKSEDVKVIREACLEVVGREIGVRITVKDGEANDSLPLSREEEERRENQNLRAAAEQNPVVQQVLRKFRGEIVDVHRVNESGPGNSPQ